MAVLGADEFYKFLEERTNAPGEFIARPFYSREGDTLYFYARDVQSYAKRLNPILTLFLATDDDTLVGFKVKGIQRILKAMERLEIDRLCLTDEKRLTLKCILEFALVQQPDDPALSSYENAIRLYDDVGVDRSELQEA